MKEPKKPGASAPKKQPDKKKTDKADKADKTDRPPSKSDAEANLRPEHAERTQQDEVEARALGRRLKADDDKRRVEEERKKKEQAKKQRIEKLKGAFAVDGDDSEDERQAELARRAQQKQDAVVHPSAAQKSARAPQPALAVLESLPSLPVNPEIASKLRVEPGLDPAVAFMRLQERKRKGRRSEFGGPPRGCSPWRDGRKGVSWERPSGDGDSSGERS